jgi:hypothetical protein
MYYEESLHHHPKEILLLEAEKHAPTYRLAMPPSLREPVKLRSFLKMRRFGRTDYVKITDLNHFAL